MMELRTRVNIQKSSEKITYSSPVFLIGSCFAAEMGAKLAEGKIPVMINPAGTVYNPVSVINTLDLIRSGKEMTTDDLFCHDETWLSFSHYTNFTSSDPDKVIEKINNASVTARHFLKKARFLFITFGTSRVFRLKESGEIVSNCHKLPSSYFERELLSADDIVRQWKKELDRLKTDFPDLRVIFTISPVRHWKDGAHGNQVSKSVLFLAIEEILRHSSCPAYFPAYEIMMDELRDYRFYSDDMLHPSPVAVNYIWEAFSQCYLDDITMAAWKDAAKIARAIQHRISSDNIIKIREFADNMLSRIEKLQSSVKEIDLTAEEIYFQSLKETRLLL